MRFRFRACPAILAVLLATAGAASAQQDAFCICLDPMDQSTCGGNAVIPVGVPTNIYLCLLNPSGDQVHAWEARVTDDAAAGVYSGEWCLNGGLDCDADPEDFLVGNCPAPWATERRRRHHVRFHLSQSP
ncbi:MAG: hypothetical protein IPI34_05625 [bacterium]|nr:hypothetical protein [bacterium]